VADTTKIEDKVERKKIKRAARKKAAPKAKRTEPARLQQEEGQEAGTRPVQAVSRLQSIRTGRFGPVLF
jgi:hypothetical protein